MGEGRVRDHVEELEGQLQAAGALVESLEEEVASLRRDLEKASVALRAAQEEVSAREEALEKKEQDRLASEAESRRLSETLSELRTKNSEEQLHLTNRHISELSRLQDRFHAQLWARIEIALSTEDAEALKSEYREIREEMDQAYREWIEPLETSYREARDRLLNSEYELEDQHSKEAEAIRKETEERLRRQFDERLESELEKAAEKHEKELTVLRESAAQLEEEVRREYQNQLEAQQTTLEADREAREAELKEAEERHRKELRKIKSVAENREQELKKAHAARLSEMKTEADRRLETLEAQREADLQALRESHEEELANLRESPASNLVGEAENPAFSTEEGAAERTMPWEAALVLQEQVKDLERALSESERARSALWEELEGLQNRRETKPTGVSDNEHDEEAQRLLDERDAEMARNEERIEELEARLTEVQDQARRRTEELERATESLRQFSEPEHRLRGGIEEFNASEHARHVASISKSLGLPKVHAGISGDSPGKPVFTFVWERLAWRRYTAEPVEGVKEPRVYLVGGGDEAEELPDSEKKPNARIDSRGRILLGVQAR